MVLLRMAAVVLLPTGPPRCLMPLVEEGLEVLPIRYTVLVVIMGIRLFNLTLEEGLT